MAKITKSGSEKSATKSKGDNSKHITMFSLALMGFTCVWGFGNIANGFGYFGGTRVIIPWILVFVLYFAPYALMVGELGSTFKDKAGGVSSWIQETIGPKIAFFCGWIYWVVHTPYMSQKPSNMIIAANWAIFQNGSVSDYDVRVVQLIGLAIFIICVLLALRGIKVIKIISSVAGMASFVMGLLYILMVWTAPAINPNVQLNTINFEIGNFMPDDWTAILDLSVLIFAVGGIEKLSPYVNQMKNGKREFPASMIVVMVMVMVCAFLGTFAMGMMFDINNIPDDFLTNGQYKAFEILGSYYNVGNLFVIIFACTNFITNFAVLIISLDAPLRIMLGNSDKEFIPAALLKQNKNGSYKNGVLLEFIIVTVLILLPCLGIGDIDSLVKWLIKLNSVCMPLRYMFVFAAYIALKRSMSKFNNDGYVFAKNKYIGIILGGWCFFVTAICCLMGMYSEDTFQLIANILTPIVLLALGFIMPAIAKRGNNKPVKK